MKIWIISDTHIDHRSMIRTCGRPENFSRTILRNWEKKVENKDLVIHLGDLAWGHNDEGLKKLLKMPGKKILVRGNHDPKSLEAYMDLGFAFACDEFVMNVEGVRMLFTHRPRIGHTFDINVHGHEHDVHRVSETGLFLPIALEVQGYEPIELTNDRMRLIRSWSDKYKQDGSRPSLNALRKFGPNPIPELRERDHIGRAGLDAKDNEEE
jgi:calcineurin-like phosphoesterase family protein